MLEDPEPAVRREVCSALYKLCLGVSASGEGPEGSLIAPMLSQLLTYMEKAESMRPQKLEVSCSNSVNYEIGRFIFFSQFRHQKKEKNRMVLLVEIIFG